MPLGGEGSRFRNQGFNVPKPLIEINNKPFFFWAVQSIKKFLELSGITFVVLKEHIENFEIDKKILSFFEDAQIEVIPQVLNGAVMTCLEGVKNISNESHIMFNDCDHMFSCRSFCNYFSNEHLDNLDGALLTFKSNDPKFSFAQIGNDNYLVKTAEKQAISDNAICGAYYFKNKKIFQKSAEKYLTVCSYKEYFMSGVYNVMAENNMHVKIFNVDFHLSFGTPKEYQDAIGSNYFEELL